MAVEVERQMKEWRTDHQKQKNQKQYCHHLEKTCCPVRNVVVHLLDEATKDRNVSDKTEMIEYTIIIVIIMTESYYNI